MTVKVKGKTSTVADAGDLSSLKFPDAVSAVENDFGASISLANIAMPGHGNTPSNEPSPYQGRMKVSGVALDLPTTKRLDDALDVVERETDYLLQITITDPFEKVVYGKRDAVRPKRTECSLDGKGHRPSVTIQFRLSKDEFELLDRPKFKLSYIDKSDPIVALDYDGANDILNRPSSNLHSKLTLLKSIADEFAQDYVKDRGKEEQLGNERRSYRSDSDWGGDAGRMGTLFMNCASRAIGEYFVRRGAPGIFTVLHTEGDRWQIGKPLRREFSADSSEGVLERPQARITSPMLNDVDFYNLRVLKALLQQESMPATERHLTEIVKSENRKIEEANLARKEAKINVRSRNELHSAVGRLRQGTYSAKDMARVLSTRVRGEQLEQAQDRRDVYEHLIRNPKQAEAVVDSLIHGAVITRASGRANKKFGGAVFEMKRRGRAEMDRDSSRSEIVAKGKNVGMKSIQAARLEALVGLFEGLSPPESAQYLHELKVDMGIAKAPNTEIQEAGAQSQSLQVA